MTTDEILAQMDSEYERAKTEPEQKFLEDVSNTALYWAELGGTPESVASGVAFSMLSMIDGASLASPPLNLAYVHENEETETCYSGEVFNDESQLHESFFPIYREQAKKQGHQVVGNNVLITPKPNTSQPSVEPVKSTEHYTTAIEALVKELRPGEQLNPGEAEAIAGACVRDNVEIRDMLTNLAIRINNPPPVTTLQDVQAVKVDEAFAGPTVPPADVSDKMGWLFDNLPAMVGLTDKQKTNIRKDFDASSKKLNDAVQTLAARMRDQMDLVAYTVERGNVELMPKFDKVLSKEKRVNELIENCLDISEHWATEAETPREAAEGAVRSVLAMLDGQGDIPAMDLIPPALPELVIEYNDDGIAGWPEESINDEVDLSDRFARALKRRRREAAKSLA